MTEIAWIFNKLGWLCYSYLVFQLETISFVLFYESSILE